MKSHHFRELELAAEPEGLPFPDPPQTATATQHGSHEGGRENATSNRRCYSFIEHHALKRQRRDSYLGSHPPQELQTIQPQTIHDFGVTKHLGPTATGDCDAFPHGPKPADPANVLGLATPALTWPGHTQTQFPGNSNRIAGDQGLTPEYGMHPGLGGGGIFTGHHVDPKVDHYTHIGKAMGPPITMLDGGTQFHESLNPSSATVHGNDGNDVPASGNTGNGHEAASYDNIDYDIGASDEEHMAVLLDAVVETPPMIPPSSVTRGMGCGSSAEVFDPNLQRSSPNKSATGGIHNQDEDLLDHEVDWDEVMSSLPSRPYGPSLLVSRKALFTARMAPNSGSTATRVDTPVTRHQPFVRPKFPAVVRDKSPIAGVSSFSILRTCFRIGEMLNEGKRASLANQDVVFELYARVTYSAREDTHHVQHFQFIDLYKDQLPYPTGKLTGWKTGSAMDHQSKAFLGSNRGSKAKLCRCLGRLTKDKKADLGWALVVLTIREVDWEEVELMKQIVCQQ